MNPTGTESHALVIGGSMSGLLAARVLADHFDRVTVIERDALPDHPTARRGVPQARHNHVLLARGWVILQQLFPALEAELLPAGAMPIDMASDIAWLTPAGWGIPFRSDFGALACSRDLLEWGVRRQLATHANVHFLAQYAADSLLTDGNGAIAGARLLPDAQAPQSFEALSIPANLVVDASGRGSRAPQWLAALGYPAPRETCVNASLGYSSRMFRRTSRQRQWEGIYLQAAPPAHTRVGVLLPVEGDRWHVTLGGGDGDYPPTDEHGFYEFAKSLRDPLLYEAIKDAEPLSPIIGTRGTENRLRHWEALDPQLEGLIVLGDAACAFNPVYGQGMTTAALGAMTLDACLRVQGPRVGNGDLGGFAGAFQRQLAQVNAVPWMLATGEDLRYRTTTGQQASMSTRFMHWYMDQVMALSTERVDVRRVLIEAFNMLQSPNTLFHPRIALRVLSRAASSIIPRRAASPQAASSPQVAPAGKP